MDIYITTPRDANAFINIDAEEMAWVIYMGNEAVPQESLDLLHALQSLEDWTSGEIKRIDDESLALWNTLHNIEDWTISEIENTKNWVSGQFKDVEEDFSELLELLNNEIGKLNKTDASQRAVLQNHTQVLKVLYNRTLALREVLLALKNEFIYFVNETIIAIHGLKDNVIILTANMTNLEENVSAFNEKISNLEDDIRSLEAEMSRLGYILGGIGGVGLIAIGFFYGNRRYHFGEIIRNGNGYFKNGRQNRFTEFIEKNKIIKENNNKARRANSKTPLAKRKPIKRNSKKSPLRFLFLMKPNRNKASSSKKTIKINSEITFKKRKRLRRNPEKSPLRILTNIERKIKKLHSRMRVQRKLEVKRKEQDYNDLIRTIDAELVKQKRQEKILAKKKAREKAKADKKAQRKTQLQAKQKQKEQTKQKRQEQILAKKKAREHAKVNKKIARSRRIHIRRNPEKPPLRILTNGAKKTKKSRLRMRIRRNPEKSPLRFLFSFLFSNK